VGKEKNDPTYRIFEMEVLVAKQCTIFTNLKYCLFSHAFTFITWSHAYCLLPEVTFGRRKIHTLKPALRYDRQTISRILRNSQRDFDMEVTPIDIRDSQRGNHHMAKEKPSRVDPGPRRIGDKYTWSIPLSTEGIQPSASPPILTTHAMFRVLPVRHPDTEYMGSNRTHPTAHYEVHAKLIDVLCLKHRYMTYPCAMIKVAPHLCATRYLGLSNIQLDSMAIEDRPPDYNAICRTGLDFRWIKLRPVYTPPRYWKYYDEEVQQILHERWSTQHEGKDML
jgi:hypothetical protein